MGKTHSGRTTRGKKPGFKPVKKVIQRHVQEIKDIIKKAIQPLHKQLSFNI
jgi:hypothetical protein